MSTPLPTAGRRRFWLTVLAFAFANALVWIGYHQLNESRKAGVLRVERFSHGANGVAPTARPKLAWTFNLDIAPGAPGQPVGSIAPAVPGTWDWANPRTLTFTPEADLPKATRFTVTLPPAADRLRTPEGFSLREAHVATFQTAPLALTQARQAAFEGDRVVLELMFDDAVNAADVMTHLSLSGPDGKPLTFEPHGLADGPIVRLRTAPLPPTTAAPGSAGQQSIQLTLSAGLAGKSGPLAMAEATVLTVPVDAELIAMDATALNARYGQSGIRVGFNNDVDAELLRPLISVEPAIPFTVSKSNHGIVLNGDFIPGMRYAIKLAAPPDGVDKSRFPRPRTLSVFVPDRERSVWFEHESGYLGSRGNRTLLAHAVNVTNLKIRVIRLYDNNVVEWRNATDRASGDAALDPYAAPLVERDIRLSGKKNEQQEIRVALDDLLPAGDARDGAYRIELRQPNEDEDGYLYASSVVTLSDIGLSAKTGRDAVTAWATSLATAEPNAGVRLRVFSNKNQLLGESLSGADGLAKIALKTPADGEQPTVLVADRSGSGTVTWLDLRTSRVVFEEADTSGRAYLRTGHEAFVYTDRGVYRPGETAHLRAIVRGPDNAVPKTAFPVLFQIIRPDLRNWRSHTTTLDADGAAGFELPLPSDLATGKWTAKIGLPGDGTAKNPTWLGTVAFQVEEFMPDRMKVELSLGSESPRSAIGEKTMRAEVQADYLFGRPVADRPATLVARVDPSTFQPAGWKGWTFADSAAAAGPLGLHKPLGRRGELPSANLSAKGRASWDLDIRHLISEGEPLDEKFKGSPDSNKAFAGPWTLTTTACVTEEGGRGVSASRQVEMDLIPHYVGLRKPSQIIQPGTAAAFDIATVAAATGKAVAAETELKAMLYRESWNNSLVRENGQYCYDTTRILEPVTEQNAAVLSTLTDGRGTCDVIAPSAGSFVLRLVDSKTGAEASVAFHAGYDAWNDEISREDPEKLEVVLLPPDAMGEIAKAVRNRDGSAMKQAGQRLLAAAAQDPSDRTFAIGDRPRVLVRSPFRGRLLLNIETDSIVSSHVIDMAASQVTVPIDVTAACQPNAYITATVIRPIDPEAKWRAHRAVGVTRLRVDNSNRKLNVQIAAPAEIRPATSLTTEIRITDSTGRPVSNAAVTVTAVDEGICRLTRFKTPDPFGFFTATRALTVEFADLYGQLMPEVPKTSSPGGDGSDEGDSRYRSPVAAKRVKPVALFAGVVRTDASGIARASFPVPQFVGELRVMAVAYTGASLALPGFGSSDRPVAVRSPLIVQSSWPRFAAPGDRFTVPFVVFNSGTGSSDVKLNLQIDGPLKFAAGDAHRSLRSLRVSPGGQAVDSVEVVALERIGVAQIRLVATMDGETFEEAIELPIRPASPAITRGGFAAVAPGEPARIDVPPGMIDGTGKVQVNVSPWPTLELPQGLDYLDRYPHGCAEQTISTLLPLAYLGDIGRQISPELFDRERVAEKVRIGIIRLLGMRTADGGVAMWAGERASWPWTSIYAAHFAVEARSAGHEVPDDFHDGLLIYARELLARGSGDPGVLEAQAYACYVLALAGKPDRAAMSRLSEMLHRPADAHARAHIAAAWIAAGRKDLAQALIPTTLPMPRTKRELSGNIGSPVRNRAVMLSALLAAQPDRADLPALAQHLADAGRMGQWQSTQDTAFALMALGRYLKHAAKSEPYTSVELLRAGKPVATAMRGEPVAWTESSRMSSDAFEVNVAGPAGARAHVAWLQVGVPATPPADVSSGMTLRRRYLDERGNSLRDNAIRSGDLVKIELTLESPNALENVVVEDLLPAGLEIENPRLATQAPDADKGPQTFETRRVDMRDDRLILVGDIQPATPLTYSYTARAVSSGTFVVPPVRAECMYDIGTHALTGGGGTLRVVATGSNALAGVGEE